MRLSISKIKLFKSCRRAYQLRYVEGLVPAQKSEALQTGTDYHKLLEELNNGTSLAGNPEYADDFSKEMAMARAYEKYIFPKFHVVAAEKWLEYDLGNGNTLVGIADAIADDNSYLYAWVKENPNFEVGIKELGDISTINPGVKKGNRSLLNWTNKELEKLGKAGFFEKAYNATLKDFFGSDITAKDIVLEGKSE